jgi:transcriptional regulator with PAS, ATPase and Fis domain
MPIRRPFDVVLQPVMQSTAMRQLDRIVRTIATKDVGVTLVGESGTGKEILARRLHDLSHRRAGPFIPINCAAIPESLFESELFGHEKGSFTGASERARGKIEASHGGSLFLDEIGEMPLAVQAKLLRFLENRKFMRVGGTTKIVVDTRIICATLRPLDHEVKAGRFRADLYYRIQGICLNVPPLRDRRADVPPLVRQFVAQSSAKHGVKAPKISRATLAILRSYDWPGNVRELRNVIELVSLLRAGRQVRVRDLPESLQQAPSSQHANGVETRPADKDILEVRLSHRLDEIIRQVLDAVLALEGGNRSQAAERLGISLRTVQRHLARV